MAIILKKGDKGEHVKALQKALGITADGDFGFNTESKVKEYQKSKGLTADGVVGVTTLKELGILLEESKLTTVNTSNHSDINITLSPISKNITNKTRDIKYIVVHFTAGGSSTKGNAMAVRNLFNKGTRPASADFVVDDETIVQCNPNLKNYICWAVGDGKGNYGITNTNSVSIEMCSTLKKGTSASVPNHSGWTITDKVIDNTVKLVKHLMKELNLPSDKVIRHYDASRKSCPGIIGWNDNDLYDEKGKPLGKKNNSDEWKKFKEKIK